MANPGSSSEPPNKGLKGTLIKGMIGAVTLAGTTAVPIIVQRALTPPSSPQNPPAEIKPAQMAPATASPQDLSGAVRQNDDDDDDDD
jgi:hypothetical protein